MTRDEFLALPTSRETMNIAESKMATLRETGEFTALKINARLAQIQHLARDPGLAYRELAALADEINAVLRSYAVCREGCSHCCHIAVVIPEFEARQIGMACGTPPRSQPKRIMPIDKEEVRKLYFGVPCPFLRDQRCSIYRHRPLACRVFANVGDNAGNCSVTIPPELSLVPQLNLQPFWLTVAAIFGPTGFADLRDFFPPEAQACE